MAADRRERAKSIRAARDWLTGAEHALAGEDDLAGDLKLMLARAELARIAADRRARWPPARQAGHRPDRHHSDGNRHEARESEPSFPMERGQDRRRRVVVLLHPLSLHAAPPGPEGVG